MPLNVKLNEKSQACLTYIGYIGFYTRVVNPPILFSNVLHYYFINIINT